MVINAEQVINVKQDPVPVVKSKSFFPTKTFFSSWHRCNTSLIFSAVSYGEPRGLETRCFWNCPFWRPPRPRSQPRLPVLKNQLYWCITYIQLNSSILSVQFVLINVYTHATTIWCNQDRYLFIAFSFGIQSMSLKAHILPLTLAPGIHWSIFVPIVYKLVILKIHNSEEMFRQYLVSKQQFTLILLFLD